VPPLVVSSRTVRIVDMTEIPHGKKHRRPSRDINASCLGEYNMLRQATANMGGCWHFRPSRARSVAEEESVPEAPLPLYSGGEGVGVRGRLFFVAFYSLTPNPSPPEYRGRGGAWGTDSQRRAGNRLPRCVPCAARN
jgi:hypothetical protein